jgi:hypothetical protein
MLKDGDATVVASIGNALVEKRRQHVVEAESVQPVSLFES